MPAYAPNYTARVRVKYRAALGVHTQTWRLPTLGFLSVGLNAALSAIEAIWSHFGPICFDDLQCLAVTYADVDSNIFLPASVIAMTGAIATPTDNPSIKADAISIVGRTATGQPAKEFFYGVDASIFNVPGQQNYRLNPGESGDVDGGIAEANGFLIDLVLCGSDGTGITWYPYANQKPNDYWVKRLRQGS
jgi:hypothetical protein